MIVGVNYPWSTARYRTERGWEVIESYGSDIGKIDILPTAVNRYGTHPLLDRIPQHTRPAWIARLNADLADYSDPRSPLQVVRWFLFPNCLTYGRFGFDGELRPRNMLRDDLNRTEDYLFNPPNLGDLQLLSRRPDLLQIRLDFEEILRRFMMTRGRVKLLPVILNFQAITLNPRENVPNGPPDHYLAGYRRRLFTDRSTWQRFFDNLLTPLLEISRPYADAIYAWDLINEPELLFDEQTRYPPSNHSPPITNATLRDFLTDGIRVINDFRLQPLLRGGPTRYKSTVGYSHYSTMKGWNDVPLVPGTDATFGSEQVRCTLDQFHYYGGLYKEGGLPYAMTPQAIADRFPDPAPNAPQDHNAIYSRRNILPRIIGAKRPGVDMIIGEIATNMDPFFRDEHGARVPFGPGQVVDPFYISQNPYLNRVLSGRLSTRLEFINTQGYDAALLWSADANAPRHPNADARANFYEFEGDEVWDPLVRAYRRPRLASLRRQLALYYSGLSNQGRTR